MRFSKLPADVLPAGGFLPGDDSMNAAQEREMARVRAAVKKPTLEDLRTTTEMLPAPEYTNAAVASAVARCRRDGSPLQRVIASNSKGHFGYDLPGHDARMMERELKFNGYSNVERFPVPVK